jgi:hypothetical protein
MFSEKSEANSSNPRFTYNLVNEYLGFWVKKIMQWRGESKKPTGIHPTTVVYFSKESTTKCLRAKGQGLLCRSNIPRYFYAIRCWMCLAAKYEPGCNLFIRESVVGVHCYRALHQFSHARSAYTALAAVWRINPGVYCSVENAFSMCVEVERG